MTQTPTAPTDLRLACEVHFPGEPGYDDARTPWNLAVVQWPAAVALPRSTAEVSALVRSAAAMGLRIAPQSTGHGAAALGEQHLSDVVLVRLDHFTGVVVDPERRTARIAAGTLWRDVVAAAVPHGLTALHGSAGDVAVAGYLLGGGLSFYGRTFGLASSSLRSIEIVTAAGDVVHASAQENAELFWAVRGGGGNFGIVTSLEIELIPVTDVFAGMLLWDITRAADVLTCWSKWTTSVPETVTTSFRLMRFPALPELPPFLSGRSLVVIDGAILESDDTATELLGSLRALSPEIDTFGRMPAAALLDVHMDPPGPVPAVSDHALLAEVTAESIDALLAVAGPNVDIPLMFAELRHLGGALERPAANGGVVDRIPAAYLLFAASPAPTPALAAVGVSVTSAVRQALEPWSIPRTFLNFADRKVDVETAFSAEDWQRLQAIRTLVDPNGVFAANHPIR